MPHLRPRPWQRAANRVICHFSQPRGHHILLACMPKSGSTFTTKVISNLPGFAQAHLVPAYGRREQELDYGKCLDAYNANYIAQHHTKHSEYTQRLIDRFDLRTVVLTRNLFDIAVSVRDHNRNMNAQSRKSIVMPDLAEMDDAEFEMFIAEHFMPWYIDFFVRWDAAGDALFVRYEDMVQSPKDYFSTILKYSGVTPKPEALDAALLASQGTQSRLNVGVTGRGVDLNPRARDHIVALTRHYKDVDFSALGIPPAHP